MGLKMGVLENFGTGVARTARAIWGRGDEPVLRSNGLGLIESDLLEAHEGQRLYEEQYAAEEELVRIADAAQKQLAAFEKLIGRSQDDAQNFGEELQDKATALTTASDAKEMVTSLVELTNAMIAKTRVATDELRSRREEMKSLRGSLQEARERADTDMLTRLANRRCFERTMATQIERCMADQAPLTLAICDIDHFKGVNDQFGHQTGDGVLKLVAKILTEHCSRDGNVFRLGGEEFAVIFPEIPTEDAVRILDGARKDLGARKLRQRGTGEFLGRVTFSAGVVTEAECSECSAETLYSVADRELYAAKEAGRNQICVAPAQAN
jgi:diguanylate cyclase